MCVFDSEFALKKLKSRFDLTWVRWVWKSSRSIQCLRSDRSVRFGDVRHDDDIKLGEVRDECKAKTIQE
jgi:hypothetical protein